MAHTLKFGLSGSTLVIVHGSGAPTDSEWDAWMERMAHADYDNILISSLGGGPTAAQRRRTNKFWRGKRVPRFSLLTTSRFVVGIVAAFNWFLNDQLRPFSPGHASQALDYIRVPEEEREALLAFVRALHRELDVEAA
jgi:hypothetical protein